MESVTAEKPDASRASDDEHLGSSSTANGFSVTLASGAIRRVCEEPQGPQGEACLFSVQSAPWCTLRRAPGGGLTVSM